MSGAERLRAAAQAVVDRWDTPNWKDAPATAEFINALRAALAAQTDVEPSPTASMNIAQRILHVGGRNNAAGYVEFGSIQAVDALVRQVLRDLPAAARGPMTTSQAWEIAGQSLNCMDAVRRTERAHGIEAALNETRVDRGVGTNGTDFGGLT